VKRILLSSVAVFAFVAVGHADELLGTQAQSNQAAVRFANPADAMAADLPYKAAVKAPAPANDDLCWHGVCLYGNFDMGLAYVSHGAPSSPMIGQIQPVEANSNGSYFGVGSSQFSSSFIGLRGKQEVGDNLYAVFNLQTLFYTNSGMNQNGVGGVAQNNGLGAAPYLQDANGFGDSSKGGQMFNNAAYFGISSPTYGTFTMGRQSALTSDTIVNYDPLSGAGALSMITNEGLSGGGGVTENRIFDNSYEYRLNVGPVRLAAEMQVKSGGNSAPGNGYQGLVGFDYMGFSMDVVGSKIFDAFAFGSPLSTAQQNLLTTNQTTSAASGAGGVFYAVTCSVGCVGGTVSDNTAFQIAAKYTIGSWKLFGGFEQIRFNNPDNPLNAGAFTEGGYNIAFINNAKYITTRVENVFWAGVRYSVTRDWDVTGAYYGYRQNSFATSAASATQFVNTAGLNAVTNAAGCSDASSSACSGFMNAFSIASDWRFARHLDFYAGTMYSEKGGGLANGAVLNCGNPNIASTCNVVGGKSVISAVDVVAGLRYQF
jgi:predicted porin